MAGVIALSGFMGSGKSTVGRLVAVSLGRPFVDLDDEIESRESRSIASIFVEEGEAGFRRIEERVLGEVLREAEPGEGLVIALGGGTPTVEGCRALLRVHAHVTFLDTPPRIAWERARGGSRPLAADEDAFMQLAARRDPIYRAAADSVVQTEGSTSEEVAHLVLRDAGES